MNEEAELMQELFGITMDINILSLIATDAKLKYIVNVL